MFNLAASQLRLEVGTANENGSSSNTALTQTLAMILLEAYPLARKVVLHKHRKIPPVEITKKELNASNINLDGAYLPNADLEHAILRLSSLSNSTLTGAHFSGADLENAIMKKVDLREAEMDGTNLKGADFNQANLRGLYISNCRVDNAVFKNADLTKATIEKSEVNGVDFSDANLTETVFKDIDFTPPEQEESNIQEEIGAIRQRAVNPEAARTLETAKFVNVKGLSRGQKQLCIEKGAEFIDTNSLDKPYLLSAVE